MTDTAQTGMTEDTAIKMLRSRPAAAQKSILAKLDPAMKAKVLAKLTATATPAPKSDPTIGDPSALGDEIAGNAKDRSTAKRHSMVDNLIDTLPTAVGTGASLLGGGKKIPTGMLAAAAGGVLGEDMREVLGEHFYTDPNRKADVKNMTAKDAVEKLAVAGAEQSGAELLSRGAGGLFNKAIEKLGLKPAAESVARAAAGKGVQKTGGEAGGTAALKSLEEYVPHLPGAMGPMKAFEEKRAAQTATEITRSLDSISTRNLSKEATGQEVARTVDAMKKEAEEAANKAYNPLKKKLGLPEDATRQQMLDAAKTKKDTASLAAIRDADKAFADSRITLRKSLIKGLSDSNRPEAVSHFVQGASLAELRELKAALPPETMHSVSRNILETLFDGAKSAKTGEFDAAKILTGLKALDKDGPKSAILFGPQAEAIRSSLHEIGEIQHNLKLGGLKGALHAYGVPAALGATVLGALTGHPTESVIALTGAMGGARSLAWLMTNPETALKTLTILRKIAAGTIRISPAAIDLYNGSSVPEVNDENTFRQVDPIAHAMSQGGRR